MLFILGNGERRRLQNTSMPMGSASATAALECSGVALSELSVVGLIHASLAQTVIRLPYSSHAAAWPTPTTVVELISSGKGR